MAEEYRYSVIKTLKRKQNKIPRIYTTENQQHIDTSDTKTKKNRIQTWCKSYYSITQNNTSNRNY